MTSLVLVFVESQRQKIRLLLRRSPHADACLLEMPLLIEGKGKRGEKRRPLIEPYWRVVPRYE